MVEPFSVSVITLYFIYLHFYLHWNLIDANGKSEHHIPCVLPQKPLNIEENLF